MPARQGQASPILPPLPSAAQPVRLGRGFHGRLAVYVKCPKCQAVNGEGSELCHYCGHRLRKPDHLIPTVCPICEQKCSPLIDTCPSCRHPLTQEALERPYREAEAFEKAKKRFRIWNYVSWGFMLLAAYYLARLFLGLY